MPSTHVNRRIVAASLAGTLGEKILADQLYAWPVEYYEPLAEYNTTGATNSHPSYFHDEIARNGFKKWLANAPYPVEEDENPHILARLILEEWGEPTMGVNPLDDATGVGTGFPFNADPHLTFDPKGQRMILSWQWNDNIDTIIYYRANAIGDPGNWTAKTEILRTNKTVDSLISASGSLIFNTNNVTLHYVLIDETLYPGQDRSYSLRRRVASTPEDLQAAAENICTLDNIPATKHLWHQEVQWSTYHQQYIAVFNFTDFAAAPNNGGVNRFGFSDAGVDFAVDSENTTINLVSNGTDTYKATMARDDEAIRNGAEFTMFYNERNGWTIRKTYVYRKQSNPPLLRLDVLDIADLKGLYATARFRSTSTGIPILEVAKLKENEPIGSGDNISTIVGQGYSTTTHSWKIVPGSVTITDGTQIITDNMNGVLSGDGSGTVDYESGTLPTLSWNSAPPSGTDNCVMTFLYDEIAIDSVEGPINKDLVLHGEKETLLETWLGADQPCCTSIVDQSVEDGNYLRFRNYVKMSQRTFTDENGVVVSKFWTLDGDNTTFDSYLETVKPVGAAIVMCKAKLTTGTMMSLNAGASYFGVLSTASTSNIYLLSSTNINTNHLPTPAMWTGKYSASAAYIMRDNTQIQSGTTAVPASNEWSLMSRFDATPPNIEFMDGWASMFMFFADTLSDVDRDIAIVEGNTMFLTPIRRGAEDIFTDDNGTLITAHTPTFPTTASWTATDTTWEIQSNQLVKNLGTPAAVSASYIDTQYVEGEITATIDDNGTNNGSGVLVWYVDDLNYAYMRSFNNTLGQLIRVVAGSTDIPLTITLNLNQDLHIYFIQIKKIVGSNDLNVRVTGDGIYENDYTETTAAFLTETDRGFISILQPVIYDTFLFNAY